jgi:thiamine biosynthesis lipoprotein
VSGEQPSLPPAVRLAGPGPWQRRTHVELVWGTAVTFDLRGAELGPEVDQVLADAAAYLHRVDAWFSTYRIDTPITMLRTGLITEALTPTVVQEVLASCRYARQLTGGVFDPWAVPGGVDPSGYVKGWAAGQVADQIVAAGVADVCVNAAGDIACRGQQAPGQLWSVGILNPDNTQEIVEVVEVGDGAIATSGLYERGAHIVNPRTGHNEVCYQSATIVGPDAGLADALATAALIVGPDAVAWFAGLPDWSGYFVLDGQASFFGPAFGGDA